MNPDEHSISIHKQCDAYFWRCTCGRDGVSVANVHVAERYGNHHVYMTMLCAYQSDYLLGTDLDVALSDYTPDIVEPADRQTQVIDLPRYTDVQRTEILYEHYESLTALKRNLGRQA